MTRGKVIVVEGMDGSGKETQSELVYKDLKKMGIRAIKLSFPNYKDESSIPVKRYLAGEYEDITKRNDIISYVNSMSLFYTTDRIATFRSTNNEFGVSAFELLNSGWHIILDRYTTSNILHQSANIDDYMNARLYTQWIMNLEYEVCKLPKPDIILYLDVNPTVAEANIKNRNIGKDVGVDIHEKIEHLKRVYKYREMLLDIPECKQIQCCSEGGDAMLSPQTIHDKIMNRIGDVINV